MMRSTSFVLGALFALAVGCGEDVNDVDPRVIPGGGIGDGRIEGELNVHVIDSADDSPVVGASVLIGDSGETLIEGTTDSAGLVVFTDDALDGPTTVTVLAPGYVTTTWFGANGANVTIAIDDDQSAQVPQAQLEGTIEGWNDLPTPAQNFLVVGLVNYSQTRVLGDPANNLPQGSIGTLPANACIRTQFVNNCSWTLNARTGDIALVALIVEIDTKGTETSSDDTSEVIGFAHKLSHSVEDGIDQSGIVLEQVEAGLIGTLTVSLDAQPSALTETALLTSIDLGDDRGLALVSASSEGEGDQLVPELAGPFAGMAYQVTAFAGTMDAREQSPASAILSRNITTAEVDLGPWLDLPTGLSESSGEFSYEPVDGALFHTATFRDDSDDRVWEAALFDGRTTFSRPAIPDDPLPESSLDMSVTAFEGDIDLDDFSIDEVFDLIQRVSVARDNLR